MTQVLAVISVGGVLGALTRYGIGLAWPHPAGAFPWATWTINVSGCFLIGILLTVIGFSSRSHPLVRPFFGTGFLGGYTTFSTAIVDLQHARPGIALLYLFSTIASALVAVWAGSTLTAKVIGR